MNVGRMPVATKLPTRAAVLVDAFLLELEDVLHDDRVLFHADDFGDVGDLARTALQAVGLDDQVDGAGDLRAAWPCSGSSKPAIMIIVSRRATASRGVLAWQRGQRAFVAGVHGLQHVERFRTAALADDDPVGPHTQGVAHQVGGRDRALAFDVRRAGFEPHDVVLLQLQFGRVFDRDDAVVVRR